MIKQTFVNAVQEWMFRVTNHDMSNPNWWVMWLKSCTCKMTKWYFWTSCSVISKVGIFIGNIICQEPFRDLFTSMCVAFTYTVLFFRFMALVPHLTVKLVPVKVASCIWMRLWLWLAAASAALNCSFFLCNLRLFSVPITYDIGITKIDHPTYTVLIIKHDNIFGLTSPTFNEKCLYDQWKGLALNPLNTVTEWLEFCYLVTWGTLRISPEWTDNLLAWCDALTPEHVCASFQKD